MKDENRYHFGDCEITIKTRTAFQSKIKLTGTASRGVLVVNDDGPQTLTIEGFIQASIAMGKEKLPRKRKRK